MRAMLRRTARHLPWAPLLPLPMLLLSGCAGLLTPGLEVAGFSPHSGEVDTVSGLEISLTFNRTTNRRSVEDAFSVVGGDQDVLGTVRWVGDRRFVFDPLTPLEEYVEYTMILTTEAEDSNGANLADDFVHRFTSRTDLQRPRLESFNPANGSVITDLRQPVTLDFSEAVDTATVFDAITVSPRVDVRYDIGADGSVVTLVPTEDYVYGEEYLVTVAADLADVQRNTIGRDTEIRFSVGIDVQAPVLQSVAANDGTLVLNVDDETDATPHINAAVNRHQGIDFTFDTPVDIESLRRAITLQPDAGFEFADELTPLQTVVRLRFRDPLEFNARYIMTIDTGIEDEFGNATTDGSRYVLDADAPEGGPIEVAQVGFYANPAGPADGRMLQAFGDIPLGNFVTQAFTYVDIVLDVAPGATIDEFDAFDAFSFSSTGGSVSTTIETLELFAASPTAPPPAAVTLNAGQILVRLGVQITYVGATGTFSVRMNDRLTDSFGNTPGASYELRINPTS